MKRKLFIGSSTEGQAFANQVKDQVNKHCGDWLDAETWNEGNVFALNDSALHSLVKASRKFDYGILVASKDDILKSRDKEHFVPRDNVMFEMGMFLGSLGLTRAFLLVEQHAKLPTDYNGVTVSYFEREFAGSIDNAIAQIIKSIESTKATFNLKPAPSAALALGYFDNFVQRLAKKRQEEGIDFKLDIILPQRIKDISTETNAYRNKNTSIETSIYGNNSRPTVFEYKDKLHNYWDIPTTLSTLRKLMDLLLPSTEIGINQEKQDWIEHELRSFAGTLEMLVKDCAACDGKVSVLWIQ